MGWILAVILSVAIVAVASLGAWQYVVKSANPPPPVANSAAAREAAVDAAKANFVTLFSFRPDTFDQDMAAAKAVLTEEAREKYTKVIDSLRNASNQSGFTSTATVSDSAVESLKGDGATILVFGKKTTASRDAPTPQDSALSIRVSMIKTADKWLVENFESL